MATLSWHPSRGPVLPDGEPRPPAPSPPPQARFVWQRADCCIAAAAYRVVLPATATQPGPGELLLCGHHFRRSRAALVRRGATVYDEHGDLVC